MDFYDYHYQGLVNPQKAQIQGQFNQLALAQLAYLQQQQALGIQAFINTNDQKIQNSYSEKEKAKMFSLYGSIKDYVKRHGDIIFTVAFIMIADRWFFNGALKGALQRLVEKMLGKADLHLDSIGKSEQQQK